MWNYCHFSIASNYQLKLLKNVFVAAVAVFAFHVILVFKMNNKSTEKYL